MRVGLFSAIYAITILLILLIAWFGATSVTIPLEAPLKAYRTAVAQIRFWFEVETKTKTYLQSLFDKVQTVALLTGAPSEESILECQKAAEQMGYNKSICIFNSSYYIKDYIPSPYIALWKLENNTSKYTFIPSWSHIGRYTSQLFYTEISNLSAYDPSMYVAFYYLYGGRPEIVLSRTLVYPIYINSTGFAIGVEFPEVHTILNMHTWRGYGLKKMRMLVTSRVPTYIMFQMLKSTVEEDLISKLQEEYLRALGIINLPVPMVYVLNEKGDEYYEIPLTLDYNASLVLYYSYLLNYTGDYLERIVDDPDLEYYVNMASRMSGGEILEELGCYADIEGVRVYSCSGFSKVEEIIGEPIETESSCNITACEKFAKYIVISALLLSNRWAEAKYILYAPTDKGPYLRVLEMLPYSELNISVSYSKQRGGATWIE